MKREIMIKAVQAASASNNAVGLEVHKALEIMIRIMRFLKPIHTNTHTHTNHTPTGVLLQIVTHCRADFLIIFFSKDRKFSGASQNVNTIQIESYCMYFVNALVCRIIRCLAASIN